jgi:hypothetical protein
MRTPVTCIFGEDGWGCPRIPAGLNPPVFFTHMSRDNNKQQTQLINSNDLLVVNTPREIEGLPAYGNNINGATFKAGAP